MHLPPASPAQLDALEALIDGWLHRAAADDPAIDAVERGDRGERRWYVRVRGEEKDVWTIWFTLGQRTLRYETYLMPAPEDDLARFFEHLLRRNRGLTGMCLLIGEDDAVFLAGSCPVGHVDEALLDQVLGSMYHYVEWVFVPALRIGFASRFDG
ncbi:MAG: YbjN domain-containing protein [Acidimicrobiales bacterium]